MGVTFGADGTARQTTQQKEGRKDQVGRGRVISSRKKSTGEVERANMLCRLDRCSYKPYLTPFLLTPALAVS